MCKIKKKRMFPSCRGLVYLREWGWEKRTAGNLLGAGEEDLNDILLNIGYLNGIFNRIPLRQWGNQGPDHQGV